MTASEAQQVIDTPRLEFGVWWGIAAGPLAWGVDLGASYAVTQHACSTGHYYVLLQPLGFLIFLICAFAECNRTPFDLSEAENELNFGYHQEYSSMKLGFYLFAEYVNMFISSAVMSTLYFGGYDIPFVNDAALGQHWGQNPVAILQAVCLFAKIVAFIFFFMWVRWTLPRFRYDQLMNLGWKVLIPLSLINMLVTGFVVLLKLNHWHF